MKNAAFQLVRGVCIVVNNATDPSKEEWDAYLALASAGMKAAGDLSRFSQLVVTDGGGPNAAQRKASVDLGKKHGDPSLIRGSVVSNSVAVRGIVTAFHWLGAPMRSFSPAEVGDALAHLGISSDAAAAICDAVEVLAAGVSGGVKSAAGFADHKRELARRAAR